MANEIGDQVIAERESTHGSFTRSALTAQSLKHVFRSALAENTAIAYVEEREAADMILFKLARIACGNPHHVDHWRDIAGYATLVVKALETK